MRSLIYDVHVCIVASNAVANLTPVLDKRFRPKQVILLERKGLVHYGDYLASVLSDVGVTCLRVNVDNVSDFDLMRQQVTDLLMQYKAGEVALNVSCGHRLLMLAAYTAFQQAGQAVFYVNPENDHLTWLSPAEYDSLDLADHLSIEQFLRLQGTTLVAAETDPVSDLFDEIFAELLSQVKRFARPFKVLNALAASARFSKSLTSQPLLVGQQYDKALQELIDVFVKHDCCQRRDNVLVFTNETARNFVNGGWLEMFACRQLQFLANEYAQIQDIARNVEISRGEQGNQVNNELDVVFMADNRMYFIECKTMDFAAVKGRMPSRKVKEKKRAAREQVYRMDSLIDQHAGFHGEGIMLSYHPLPPEILERADDLGLLVCSDESLVNFPTMIKELIITSKHRILEDLI